MNESSLRFISVINLEIDISVLKTTKMGVLGVCAEFGVIALGSVEYA